MVVRSPCSLWSFDELRMWIAMAILSVLVSFLTLGFFPWRLALFYFIPVWSTLFIFGPWVLPVRNPFCVVLVSVMLFLLSTWWVKTYPVECRREWKQKLVFDEDWDFQTWAATMKKHRSYLVPGVSEQGLEAWIQGHNQSSAAQQKPPATLVRSLMDGMVPPPGRRLSTPGSDFGSDATKADPAMATTTTSPSSPHEEEPKRKHTGGWHSAHAPVPVSNPEADDVSDFELRTYCAHYEDLGEDEEYPRVFAFVDPPKETFGQFAHDRFRSTCFPWTCTFSEQHLREKWLFYAAIVLLLTANMVHWRGVGSWSEWLLGAGQFRQWWIWFWATLLPIWSILFMTRVKACDVEDYVKVLSAEVGNIISNAQSLLMIMIFCLLLLLVYSVRDRIYQVLNIEDHNIVHWINWNNLQRIQTHSIQVCLWRVDINGDDHLTEVSDWEAMGNRRLQEDLFQQSGSSPSSSRSRPAASARSELAGMRSSRSVSRSLGLSFWPLLATEERNHQHLLEFPGNHPPNFFMRIAYGHNELQNTRVQRMVYALEDKDVIYIQENFRLTTNSNPETMLFVEANDQSLISHHQCGRMAIRERKVLEECTTNAHRWKSGLVEGSQQSSIALEQIMRMLQDGKTKGRQDAQEEDERQRKRMFIAGFRPYELSEGGVVWVAFAFLDDEQEGCAVM